MLNNPMQIIGMLQNSNNPMAMIQQIFGSNPRYSQVINIAQGKSPQQLEQYVRNLAKSQNIDLNQLASQYGFRI